MRRQRRHRIDKGSQSAGLLLRLGARMGRDSLWMSDDALVLVEAVDCTNVVTAHWVVVANVDVVDSTCVVLGWDRRTENKRYSEM